EGLHRLVGGAALHDGRVVPAREELGDVARRAAADHHPGPQAGVAERAQVGTVRLAVALLAVCLVRDAVAAEARGAGPDGAVAGADLAGLVAVVAGLGYRVAVVAFLAVRDVEGAIAAD